MFEKIPKNRLIFYALLSGLFPLCFVLVYFFSEKAQLDALSAAISRVSERASIREKKQSVNIAVRNYYRDADHFYIDKHLETLIPLEPEIESLQKIVNNTYYAEDESLKRRLDILSGPENHLTFAEGVVQSYPQFQETTETLIHPVEVNLSDLEQILARIEGLEIGSYTSPPNRPQLLILDFKINRQSVNEKNEVFVLNLKLLKREFL